MRIQKITCNICGKEFDVWDKQEGFGIHYYKVGYGSRFDGDTIDCDICCDCFDNLMTDYILPKAKTNPVIECE